MHQCLPCGNSTTDLKAAFKICANHPGCVWASWSLYCAEDKTSSKDENGLAALMQIDGANLHLSVIVLQAATQAVTQPTSRTSQLASSQPKAKATITLKNFAAVSRSWQALFQAGTWQLPISETLVSSKCLLQTCWGCVLTKLLSAAPGVTRYIAQHQ